MKVELSPLAETDLEQIGDFIAQDNSERAISFVHELTERCFALTNAPESAPLRDEIAEGIRTVPFERYMIFYRIIDDTIRVERILQGARDYFSGDIQI